METDTSESNSLILSLGIRLDESDNLVDDLVKVLVLLDAEYTSVSSQGNILEACQWRGEEFMTSSQRMSIVQPASSPLQAR